MKSLHYLILATILAVLAPAQAADPPPAAAPTEATPPPLADPEPQVTAWLRQSPAGADAIELTVEGKQVLALFRRESRGRPVGAIVLLHDAGSHADWPGVIAPLRRELPGHGWSTLAVQLPLPAPGMAAPDYPALVEAAQPRIRAALAHLKKNNIHNIVLLGHGLGALSALRQLADTPDPAITGLILVAMDNYTALQPALDTLALLEKIRAPIFDVYGSDDGAAVVAGAAQRAMVGRRLIQRQPAGERGAKAKPVYRQFALEGAGHAFEEQSAMLVRRVYGWLKSHAAGKEVEIKQ